jgi:hypothetical protein
MKWQTKAVIQAALSRVPCHRALYSWLHSRFGGVSRTLGDQLDRKIGIIKRMRANGMPVEGAIAVEIGTGWHPVLPLLLYVIGARRVITLDLNPWLTRTTLRVAVDGIEQQASRIAGEFEVPVELIQERISVAKQVTRLADVIPVRALAACNIEYRMPCDASATGLSANSVDYIISANVLEHVPKEVMVGMFGEARRVLKDGGLMYHHINPGDHFASDLRITSSNFVRFSPTAWYFLGGSGLAYHNRLRCSDYLTLVEGAGFEIRGSYSHVDSRALAALQSGEIPVHSTFRGYAPEQLACDIVGIFASPLKT